MTNCECGSLMVGGKHSTWCPCSGEEKTGERKAKTPEDYKRIGMKLVERLNMVRADAKEAEATTPFSTPPGAPGAISWINDT